MKPGLCEWLKRAASEPLVQFLVAGSLVFAVLQNRPPDLGERRIVVDEPAVSRLVGRFVDSFHRPPTPDELDGMIRGYVSDEVYYREALRLGLDKDDEVVVRRMRRKLEGSATADAEAATPSDAELEALLDQDPARYVEHPRFTFDQIYLGADDQDARIVAAGALARARQGERVFPAPAPLPAHLDKADGEAIAATFGDAFATTLAALPVGTWNGPIASGLGLHLVRVSAREAPAKPTLGSVRQRVENEWRAARIAKAQADAYSKMLGGYDIVIAPAR